MNVEQAIQILSEYSADEDVRQAVAVVSIHIRAAERKIEELEEQFKEMAELIN